MTIAIFTIWGHALLVIGLSTLYFRRYQMARPPLGVMNLWDVALMISGVILMPYLYLLLPPWLVALLLAVGVGNLLYTSAEPLLPNRRWLWLLTLLLLGADGVAAWRFGVQQAPFFLVNNSLLGIAVLGLANLWAQSGLRARDLAILAGLLTLYDFCFTAQLPLMGDLFGRLATLPFAPLIAWPVDSAGHWVALGLGDLILATVQPLVMEKAFGRLAGGCAALLNLLAIGAILALVAGGKIAIFPVMVVLGPLHLVQYYGWRWRYPHERTTWHYRLGLPTVERGC